MDDNQFAILMKKLDIIAKLLVPDVTQGKNLTEKTVMLSSIGLEPKEIALLLDKKSDLISKTLYQAKKSKGRKKVRRLDG